MKTKITNVTKTTPVKKASKVAVKKTDKAKSVSIAVKDISPKKATAKKIISPAQRKELVIASNHNSFWLNDGQILNSLKALSGALKNMESVVYKYHTANGRHDFANWVDDVLCDSDCAQALRKAKTAKSAHMVVVKYVALYK